MQEDFTALCKEYSQENPGKSSVTANLRFSVVNVLF